MYASILISLSLSLSLIIVKGYKLPTVQDDTKPLVFQTIGMCTRLSGQLIDTETWRIVSLSHFLSIPEHLHLKTVQDVLAHSNCPNQNNISVKLFHQTLLLLAYVLKFDELLDNSCPTTDTSPEKEGEKAAKGGREGNKVGRNELKDAKIAAQPGMQMAKSMTGLGVALSKT